MHIQNLVVENRGINEKQQRESNPHTRLHFANEQPCVAKRTWCTVCTSFCM